MVRAPGAGGWQRRPQARADSVLFAEPPQPKRRVFLRRKVLFLLRPLSADRRTIPRKRHADGFGTFNFATLVFLLLARHSPQAVSARAACVGCHQKYRESRDDVAGVLYLFSAKRYPKTPRQMPAHPTCRLNAGFGRPPKRRVLGGCANIHKTGVLRRRSRF